MYFESSILGVIIFLVTTVWLHNIEFWFEVSIFIITFVLSDAIMGLFLVEREDGVLIPKLFSWSHINGKPLQFYSFVISIIIGGIVSNLVVYEIVNRLPMFWFIVSYFFINIISLGFAYFWFERRYLKRSTGDIQSSPLRQGTKTLLVIGVIGLIVMVATDLPIILYFDHSLPKLIPINFAAGILQAVISYDGVLLGLVAAVFGAFITLNYSKTTMKLNFVYLLLLGFGVIFFVSVIIRGFIDYVNISAMNPNDPAQGFSVYELGILLAQSVNGVWAFIISMAAAIVLSREESH